MAINIRVLSPGIRKIPHLVAFLDATIVASPISISQKNIHAVAGWGLHNHAPELELPALAFGLDARVLVVDQTRGDMSVVLGGGEEDVVAMVEAALTENPTAQIIVKIHPDVLSGKKKGYLTDTELLANPRVLLWAEDCSPLHLLRQIDQVYVYTSQLGFEALLHGKAVHCYGGPFYAGWGLTTDHYPLSHRQRSLSVEQLVYATIFQYPRYIMPPGVGVKGFAEPISVLAYFSTKQKSDSSYLLNKKTNTNKNLYKELLIWINGKKHKARALWDIIKRLYF